MIYLAMYKGMGPLVDYLQEYTNALQQMNM